MDNSYFDVMECLDAIAEFLDNQYNTLKFAGFSTKSNTEGVDGFEGVRPYIYKYCVPPDARNTANFPRRCPCITLVVEGAEPTPLTSGAGYVAECAAVIVVYNPSTNDAETATPVECSDSLYNLGEGTEYSNTLAQYNLYVSCLRAGFQLLGLLNRMRCGEFVIRDLRLTPPEQGLINYPYAQCTVAFTIEILIPPSKIFGDAYKNLL